MTTLSWETLEKGVICVTVQLITSLLSDVNDDKWVVMIHYGGCYLLIAPTDILSRMFLWSCEVLMIAPKPTELWYTFCSHVGGAKLQQKWCWKPKLWARIPRFYIKIYCSSVSQNSFIFSEPGLNKNTVLWNQKAPNMPVTSKLAQTHTAPTDVVCDISACLPTYRYMNPWCH